MSQIDDSTLTNLERQYASGLTSADLIDVCSAHGIQLSEATLRSLDEDAHPPEPRGHLLPAEAGAAARDGKAGALVLTHLPVNGHGEWAREAAVDEFGGDVAIAEPSATYEV